MNYIICIYQYGKLEYNGQHTEQLLIVVASLRLVFSPCSRFPNKRRPRFFELCQQVGKCRASGAPAVFWNFNAL